MDTGFVLDEEIVSDGAGDGLYLSEISPGGIQAVSLRPFPAKDVNGLIAAFSASLPGSPYRPAPDSGSAAVIVSSTRGDQSWTSAYAVVSLSRRLAAFMEIHLKDLGRESALGAVHALRRRVERSLDGAVPGPLLEKWIPRLLWAAAVLSTYGGIAFSFSHTRANMWTAFAGFLVFLLAVGIAVNRGLKIAGAGRSEASLGDRLLTLWVHPWILAAPATAAPVPLATIALLFWASAQQPVLLVLYWSTIAGGAALILLGSHHRLLRQVFRRKDEGPAALGDDWQEIRTIPEGFPALPDGRVTGIYTERNGVASAVLVRPSRSREPEWVRWNQTSRTWDGPTGPVTARAHQVWDQRVETIVEVVLGNEILVVESIADERRTWGAVRRLTDHLAGRAHAPVRARGPRAFLTYSLAPLWGEYFLAVYFWIGALAFSGRAMPPLKSYMDLCFAFFLAVPLYVLVSNILATVRPGLFAVTGPRLTKRARRAVRHSFAAGVALIVPLMVFDSIFAAVSLTWVVWTALLTAVAAAIALIPLTRLHGRLK